MSNIVFAWEWGTGASHLVRFAAIAQRLNNDGHRVTVISKDESQARSLYPPSMEVYPAPAVQLQTWQRVRHPRTIASLAWNLGYQNKPAIHTVIGDWFHLIARLEPDLVVSDFGIGAAAAAIGLGCRHARIGTGFECPPPTEPLTELPVPATVPDDDQSQRHSAFICDCINSTASLPRCLTLDSFADLIGSPESTLLSTVQEFDHYRRSDQFDHLGIWESDRGQTIRWRNEGYVKAFAYLKPHRHLGNLLLELAKCGVELAVVIDGPYAADQIPSPLIVRQPAPVALDEVAQQCSFAITNGNHGTSLGLLSRGVPLLAFPMYIEQRATAQRIETLGFGYNGRMDTPSNAARAVLNILNSNCRPACDRFATKYRETFNAPALDNAYAQLTSLLP